MPDVSVSLPGPGTAALFGSALVFVALALSYQERFQKFAILVSIFGAVVLLITGIVIEYKSFKERAWEKNLKALAERYNLKTNGMTAEEICSEILKAKLTIRRKVTT